MADQNGRPKVGDVDPAGRARLRAAMQAAGRPQVKRAANSKKPKQDTLSIMQRINQSLDATAAALTGARVVPPNLPVGPGGQMRANKIDTIVTDAVNGPDKKKKKQ